MTGKKQKRNFGNDLNEDQDIGLCPGDLYTAREFYDKQMEGMGEYFFDAVFPDRVSQKLSPNEF